MSELKPELSKKNKYWLPKHRYYELKHFCLQYPAWVEELRNINLYGSINYFKGGRGKDYGDPTFALVCAREDLTIKIDLVDRCLKAADHEISEWIKIGVTCGYSFNYLKNKLNIPCERDMYYDRVRKFFYILSQEKHSV